MELFPHGFIHRNLTGFSLYRHIVYVTKVPVHYKINAVYRFQVVIHSICGSYSKEDAYLHVLQVVVFNNGTVYFFYQVSDSQQHKI